MNEKNLLNSPLHTWDGILKKYINKDQIMNMLMPMVSKNINTIPLFNHVCVYCHQMLKTYLKTIVVLKVLSPCT